MNMSNMFQGLESENSRNERNPILVSSDCVYAELENVPNWLPQTDTMDSSILSRFVSKEEENQSTRETVSTSNESFVVSVDTTRLRAAQTEKRKYRDVNTSSDNIEDMKTLSSSDLVTIDRDGFVRVFEICSDAIASSLKSWQDMFGVRARKSEENLRLTRRDVDSNLTSTPRTSTSMPKHGKIDDKNHVGGNTWAGGTGGSDTAGLGGRGGPYVVFELVCSSAKREVFEREARECLFSYSSLTHSCHLHNQN